jgi:hypothetical protein
MMLKMMLKIDHLDDAQDDAQTGLGGNTLDAIG